jgi:hypothetical protein
MNFKMLIFGRLMFRLITDEQAYALNTAEQQTRNCV